MPTEAPSLAAFRAGYWFGGFNGLTWMMGLGTPMVLLVEQLGASTLQVGLATSFVLLLYPLQIVATALLPRLGFRRQMVLAWTARALFLLVPLWLAWLAPEDPAPWMPGVLVASVFGFCFFRAFGVAAHIPWFAAVLPDALRGRFFATDSAITSAVGVATLLTCAVIFARLPTYDAFRTAYVIAVLGSTFAVVNLLRLPAGPRPPDAPVGRMLRDTRTLSLGPGLFRQYLVVSLFWLVATVPIPGFAAYYLKVETDVSSSAILAFGAAQFVGQIAGSSSIRHLIDRFPIRWFFQTASGFAIVVCLLWLTALESGSASMPLFVGAYVIFGVGVGMSQAAHFTYLPELAPAETRPVTVATFGAVSGMLSGLAPILWGIALRTGGSAPGVHLDRFAVFFWIGIALSTVGIALLHRLPDRRASVAAATP